MSFVKLSARVTAQIEDTCRYAIEMHKVSPEGVPVLRENLKRRAMADAGLAPNPEERARAFRAMIDRMPAFGESDTTSPSHAWPVSAAALALAPAGPPPIPPPDWTVWSEMLTATLVDAVGLSCNLDPAVLQRGFKPEHYPEYWRRHGIALNWSSEIPHTQDRKVRLTDFAAWATARRWSLPAEFPRPPATAVVLAPAPAPTPEPIGLTDGDPLPSARGVSISLPHTTKAMESLFGIVRRYWTDYDAKNPPKQTAIGLEIDEAMGWKSTDGKPSRTAQALAGIVRPAEVAATDKRTGRGK